MYSWARRRGFVVLLGLEGLVDIALQAGRESDQTSGVPAQQLLIDPGLVIKPVEVAGRDQPDQVLVPFLVFAQKNQVVVRFRVGPVAVTFFGDVNLASDNRVDALRRRRVVELDGSEQVPVVGHRDRGLFLLGDEIHETADLTGAVEQRIISVAMQVDEGCIGHRALQKRVPGGSTPILTLNRYLRLL